MRQVAFKQVDVFTCIPFLGNPLAVIVDATGISDHEMQRIAHWTNLSETSFVLPPTCTAADYRLRIFTTTQELPFAGHPSIGTAHALLEAGLLQPVADSWTQECGAGLLRLRRSGATPVDRRIHVQVPRAKIAPAAATLDRQIEAAFGLRPGQVDQARVVDVGAIWLVVDLDTATSVRALQPSGAALEPLCTSLGVTGITVFGRQSSGDAMLAVRSFCPGEGMFEDPACGSGNASVAAYLHGRGTLHAIGAAYRASQGRELGRDGYVDVAVDASGDIEIGGACVTCVDGIIRLK